MKDDAAVTAALAQGTLQWDPGVAPRLTHRLNTAAQTRVKKLQERFNRDLEHAQGSQAAITQALLSLRQRLADTASMLAQAGGLPQEVTQALKSYVHDSADAMQSSLLDSARADRSGKLKAILTDTPVNKF